MFYSDIDECEAAQCKPNSYCFNLPGSFSCNCSDGFEYNEKNDTCDG